ncbi:MAG: GntR family transcriptional regulator, partial [Ewingella sp.]|nr:GntR family transcriptional regulator [Ewingella sp.]
MNRYENLANVLSERIEQGLYPAGERLPSVRILSSEHGVSISTVQQAYRMLEEKLLVEARPKSGYFVTSARPQAALPAVCRPTQRPVDISQWDQVLEQITQLDKPDFIQLGRGSPDVTAPTLRPLNRAMSRAGQHQNLLALKYDTIYGALELREQIA